MGATSETEKDASQYPSPTSRPRTQSQCNVGRDVGKMLGVTAPKDQQPPKRSHILPKEIRCGRETSLSPKKLYEGENPYVEIFRNGSKIWRFGKRVPEANMILLGKYEKGSLP